MDCCSNHLIYRGAEAELYLKEWFGLKVVEKIRVEKKYRIKEIDERIRRGRMKKEIKMMVRARNAVKTPRILDIDMEKYSFLMEFIDGTPLKDCFDTERAFKVGKLVKKLHNLNIIHGDLTTANMIEKDGEIYFLDFGLAEISERIEDKATDLLVFKKMLKSGHFDVFDNVWRAFLKGYNDKEVEKKIEEIEKRARYVER